MRAAKLLKKARGTYNSENETYDKFLSNKHYIPTQTLLSSDFNSKDLTSAIERLNQNIVKLEKDSLNPFSSNKEDYYDVIKSIDSETMSNLQNKFDKLEKSKKQTGENSQQSNQLQEALVGEIRKLEEQTQAQTNFLKDLSKNMNDREKEIETHKEKIENSDTSSADDETREKIKVLEKEIEQQKNILYKNQSDLARVSNTNLQPQDSSQHKPQQQAPVNTPQPVNSNQDIQTQQQPNIPPQYTSQYPPSYPQPSINVITQGGETKKNGGDPSRPINIIAKSSDDEKKLSEEEEKSNRVKLEKIPDKILKTTSTDWEPVNYKGVDVTYQLTDLAKVTIKYDEEEEKMLYKILEPDLTEEELHHLEELKRGFIYVFEKFSPEFVNMTGKDLIVKGAMKLASKYNIKLTDDQLARITYYLGRDFLGLELIEPIMHDPYIEDVSCDGLGVPIFVNHLKYGPLEVNRKYEDAGKLNSFIVKLAQRSNQEISLSKPILQGALPDGSRVEAIYGKEVSGKGSSFTIRKFREEPFTPIHLIDLGTIPTFVLAYLWIAIENKQSLLVSGGTATGKTTILNALSLLVPPSSKIVSIEDTPEINLPHEHWLSLVSRESEEKSEVTMFDLLKASLRERPDYIIVGEIRGAEASILFQGMATGHAGLGTVHAEKFEDLVNRMTIAPINLPKQLITEVNIVVFMKQMKVKNNVVRRASSIVEIAGYNGVEDKFYTNEFVKYTPSKDEFKLSEDSAILSQLIEKRGTDANSIWQEIERRRRILEAMHSRKILDFRDVSKVFKTYYKDPSNIMSFIENFKARVENAK